jgi:hypothetical protein
VTIQTSEDRTTTGSPTSNLCNQIAGGTEPHLSYQLERNHESTDPRNPHGCPHWIPCLGHLSALRFHVVPLTIVVGRGRANVLSAGDSLSEPDIVAVDLNPLRLLSLFPTSTQCTEGTSSRLLKSTTFMLHRTAMPGCVVTETTLLPASLLLLAEVSCIT